VISIEPTKIIKDDTERNALKVTEEDGRVWVMRPPFATLRTGRLRQRSLIIGFIGARGSGKSVGASRMAIWEYMLHGYDVWSNMDIAFTLNWKGKPVKEYHSKPLDDISLTNLDDIYQNGLLLVDEVNMEFSEARRSMSNKNLMFSYILQQLRKRRMNLIWTAQSEMHCDDRLRFQSDFIIMCKDQSLVVGSKCGVGEISSWRVHDTSGIKTGELAKTVEEMIVAEWYIWNKPWWNSFDTLQLQGISRKRAEAAAAANNSIDRSEDARQLAWNIINNAKKNKVSEMPAENIWEMIGISDDLGMQISVGRHLQSIGCRRTRHGKVGRYYYSFPV
jgi:hypothetical protein